ncbi:MAG TPA: molybdenum cofactor guanylyltransferase [Pyrinomonadaceae bacterium]|jgi:molybdopterin-guanine dinucleotide biosynthesis protein A
MMKKDFTGFVLAGGKSSRMGADKYNLEIDGESFLDRAANTLRATCETVKIVLNQTQSVETDLPTVRDIYAARGALGGIHAALKNCETKFAIILAVDLPLVTGAAIENLADAALALNKYPAVVPRQTDGESQPLCAVYRAKYCLPPLEKILHESDSASVRDFLDAIFPKYIDESRLSADGNLLFNVNRPADFELLTKTGAKE